MNEAAPTDSGGSSERRAEILAVAAQVFAAKGYAGTSMRDIGAQAGVLGGSLYHHIRSKDALFVELHDAALAQSARAIAAAADAHTDPWERLRAATTRLLEIQLDPRSLTNPLMSDFREVPDDVRERLVARRDAFEEGFRALVGDLPLPRDIDRSIYRNLLLSMLNAVSGWYRPGRLTPAQIADQVLAIFRHG